jgi:alkyl-hydroperoxide reductase/thiol specific antioxidant family protein
VARVRARQDALDAANTVLVVIAAEPMERLARLARRSGWTNPVLADPERDVYRAYGLDRLPWYRVFTPKAGLKYLGFIFQGIVPGAPGQDVMQQGGDFIVDGDGILRYAHRGWTADDRPPVEDLIGCLRSIASSPGGATA